VKFEASTLDVSHHLLVTLSCKSTCENSDDTLQALQHAFAAIIAVVQQVIVDAITIAFIYLHDSDRHRHTLNRSRVATLLYSRGVQRAVREPQPGPPSHLESPLSTLWFSQSCKKILMYMKQLKCTWKNEYFVWPSEMSEVGYMAHRQKCCIPLLYCLRHRLPK